LKLLVLTDC